jgi:fatty acid desaturase
LIIACAAGKLGKMSEMGSGNIPATGLFSHPEVSMASVSVPQAKPRSLRDADLKEKLQELRQTDNYTNVYYLVRTYVYLAMVIGGAVAFDVWRPAWGLSWWWNVPVAVVAVVLVGAGQHQLSGLAHEAVHHILFRNRWLNDLASDLFCMLPLFSSTHHYRLQHLAHHQFVNDPDRDPDVSQLKTSGHWLNFPLTPRQFYRALLRQLWLPNLVRFIRVRAAYNATGTDKNPYLRKGYHTSKLAVRAGIVYLLSQVALLTWLVHRGDPLPLAVLPLALYGVAVVFYSLLPASKYHQSRVHPVIPSRVATLIRISYLTALFAGLAWLTWWTGRWAAAYYAAYWLLPLATSFAFFMILRQWVQHGNGDRGWLTNTRIFFVQRFINFSVFPIGQDYHLPHHMYATVPHYRLRQLHEALLACPDYREQAVEVHGYFRSPESPKQHPTVVDVLGPAYAAREFRGVHIDNSVLEDDVVDEKAEIVREGEEEARRLAEGAAASERAGGAPGGTA